MTPKTFYNCPLTACKVSSSYSFPSSLRKFFKLGGMENQNLRLRNFVKIQRRQISVLLLEIFTGNF